MFTTLLVALTTVIAADSGLEAKAVVRKWAEAHKDVHAVHATFVHFEHDLGFGKSKTSFGEVYFTSRTSGFWSSDLDSQEDAPKNVEHGDAARGSRDAKAERIIWKDDIVTIVDEERKRYDQMPRDASLFGWQLFPHVNTLSPFLPGLPDKTALAGWEFTIIADSDDEVRLEGVPPKTIAKQFRSCKLILRKPEMTLHAVQYTHSWGKQSVFVFKIVRHNPEKVPDIDLSEYTAGHILNFASRSGGSDRGR